MKRRSMLIAIILAMVISAGPNEAEARTTVSFSLFFDSLAPYGTWILAPTYGYVWIPRGVPRGWKPYTHGRWVWSDLYGWIWLSYEPWGWAPYHYGRWVFMPPYGWVWIPGTVWAPSWVTWYTCPGFIGWAPLPPDDQFFVEIGIRPFGFSHRTDPSHVVFVPSHRFLDPDVGRAAIPEPQGITVFRNTKNVTNIKLVDKSAINYGVGLRQIEEATGKRVQKVTVIDKDLDKRALTSGSKEVNKFEGGNLYIYRPQVVKRVDEAPKVYKREDFEGGNAMPPARIEERKSIGIPQEEPREQRFKGWSSPIEQPHKTLPIIEPPRIRKEMDTKRTPFDGETMRIPTYEWKWDAREKMREAPTMKEHIQEQPRWQPPVLEESSSTKIKREWFEHRAVPPMKTEDTRIMPERGNEVFRHYTPSRFGETISPSYERRQRNWGAPAQMRDKEQVGGTRLREAWNMEEGRRTQFKFPAIPNR